SKYSLALYELFVDYFIVKNGFGETPVISIDNFRKLLGLKENEYEKFRDLNYYIIQKSLKEINAKSDLFVEVEYRKKGRKVEAVKFFIKKNPDGVIDVEPILKRTEQQQRQGRLPLPEFEIENQELFQILTDNYGISKNKAADLLKSHDEFYIQEVLQRVNEQVKDGKVKDVAGFTIKALEDDYRVKKNVFAMEDSKKQNQKEQAKHDKVRVEQLKTEFTRHSEEKIKRALAEITEAKKNELLQSFEANELNSSDFLTKRYRQHGLGDVLVRTTFRYYAAKNLLLKEDYDFVAYAAKQGYHLAKDEMNEFMIMRKQP
ncbi:MAG: RepB family plasmid replication initiator protein, partial [Deltaproteobacteria bacterium]|nr:RepB family plasmid replication initiator protein [Deltaproteobacteria bacterium]